MPDRSQYRLGARPSTPDPRTLRLERYLDVSALPPVPAAFDWGAKVGTFGMHLNDRYGSCVPAAMANAVETDSADTSTEHVVPDAAVLKAYEDIGGFNPTDPGTDQGCDPLTAMKYWRTTGMDGHTIGAFAQVDPRNLALVKAATFVLGGLQLAMTLPVSAQSQHVWDVVANDGGVWGGHQVFIRGVAASGNLLIETWNEAIEVTPAFLARYCGHDLYAVIAQDWLDGTGRAPNGLNLAQLTADLAIVSGQPDPTPPQPVGTMTTLSLSASSITVGQPLTVNATVTGTAADGSEPTGSVTLTGAAGVTAGQVPLVQGGATFHCQPTAAGSYTIIGDYGGDATHSSSQGTAPLTVQPAPQPVHFVPAGPAATAWAVLAAGGQLATGELTLLLDSDPNGPAAVAWKYLLGGGSVQALLDAGWGSYFHVRGAA